LYRSLQVPKSKRRRTPQVNSHIGDSHPSINRGLVQLRLFNMLRTSYKRLVVRQIQTLRRSIGTGRKALLCYCAATTSVTSTLTNGISALPIYSSINLLPASFRFIETDDSCGESIVGSGTKSLASNSMTL